MFATASIPPFGLQIGIDNDGIVVLVSAFGTPIKTWLRSSIYDPGVKPSNPTNEQSIDAQTPWRQAFSTQNFVLGLRRRSIAK